MEKRLKEKFPEASQGSFEIDKSNNKNNTLDKDKDKEKENQIENNEVGAPPLVIVVQGGRGVKKLKKNKKIFIILVWKNNRNPFFSKILYKSKHKSR